MSLFVKILQNKKNQVRYISHILGGKQIGIIIWKIEKLREKNVENMSKIWGGKSSPIRMTPRHLGSGSIAGYDYHSLLWPSVMAMLVLQTVSRRLQTTHRPTDTTTGDHSK